MLNIMLVQYFVFFSYLEGKAQRMVLYPLHAPKKDASA